VADDPHQEYWKGIWCLPSEQIRHCKDIFEPESICFVDDYAAAEHVLQKLKKGAFNFQMRRRLKEQYDAFYGPLKHRLHYTPCQPYSLWISFLNLQVSGMERRNFVPAPEFDADLGKKKRPQTDEHRWTRKESPMFPEGVNEGDMDFAFVRDTHAAHALANCRPHPWKKLCATERKEGKEEEEEEEQEEQEEEEEEEELIDFGAPQFRSA
jgi:hypothetical protein